MKEQILFHNLKIGDFIGFSYPKWYKYPVAFLIRLTCFVLRKKKKGLDIQHVGQVIDLYRDNDRVLFSFAEQKGGEGKIINQYVINKFDNKYQIDSRFKHFHFLSLIKPLNDTEKEDLQIFWNNKEEYKPLDALTSTRIFKRIREKLFKEDIYSKDNFCSGACHSALYYIGRHHDTSQVDPVQFSLQPYLVIKF